MAICNTGRGGTSMPGDKPIADTRDTGRPTWLLPENCPGRGILVGQVVERRVWGQCIDKSGQK
ncbi:MAG: hypothetical protein Q9199_002059 [Rusavskia elegans]